GWWRGRADAGGGTPEYTREVSVRRGGERTIGGVAARRFAGAASPRQLLGAGVALRACPHLGGTLGWGIGGGTGRGGARYGAVGVLSEDRTGLAEFRTVGVDAATFRAIGALPQGHGILGLLIRDPRPLRLPDLREHPDSFGFPPHHPEMRSFLGVPVIVRGE